jgi:DNA invertase Pin-like site-specific DNA recombinase
MIKMATGSFVSYHRVSTQRQGLSGLGLEAQKVAVDNYLNGGNWDLVGEFVEVESGKNNDRPELAKAISLCRIHNATLVVSKLDRLARNVAFISQLMESKVEFVAVDFPQANRLTVHILAAVAEHEREAISKRTKEALAAAKARGIKLGNDNMTASIAALGRASSIKSRKKKSQERASDLVPVIEGIKERGIVTLKGIAAELNLMKIPTARGIVGNWKPTQVSRILKRLNK